MANFTDYITNIETLSEIKNEGDGNIIFKLQCVADGLAGDGEAIITFPPIECSGTMIFKSYGEAVFPILEILSQNAIGGVAEFPILESTGIMVKQITGVCPFPLLECTG